MLVLLGCGAAVIAWGPLQNLFGYRHSPVSESPSASAIARNTVLNRSVAIRRTLRGAGAER